MQRYTSTSSRAPSYRTNDPYGDRASEEASRSELFGQRRGGARDGAGSGGKDARGGYSEPSYGGGRSGDPYLAARNAPQYGNTAMANASSRGNGASSGRDGYAAPEKQQSSLYANAEEEEADSYGRTRDTYSANDGGQYSQQTQEDDEIEGIKQQMRYVKQDSLASTRNAVRTARQAEETAGTTLSKIGDQSERIAMTERALDVSKNATEKAKDEAEMLKKLNRSIFIPVLGNPFSRKKKAAEKEKKIIERYRQEKLDREDVRLQVADSQKRVGEALYGKFGETKSSGKGRQSGPMSAGDRMAERGRYQFEATESDDELEEELDHNLDELHQITGRLKGLAMATNAEVTTQNSRLDRISNKTDDLDIRILQNSRRLENIR